MYVAVNGGAVTKVPICFSLIINTQPAQNNISGGNYLRIRISARTLVFPVPSGLLPRASREYSRRRACVRCPDICMPPLVMCVPVACYSRMGAGERREYGNARSFPLEKTRTPCCWTCGVRSVLSVLPCRVFQPWTTPCPRPGTRRRPPR